MYCFEIWTEDCTAHIFGIKNSAAISCLLHFIVPRCKQVSDSIQMWYHNKEVGVGSCVQIQRTAPILCKWRK